MTVCGDPALDWLILYSDVCYPLGEKVNLQPSSSIRSLFQIWQKGVAYHLGQSVWIHSNPLLQIDLIYDVSPSLRLPRDEKR